MANFATPGGNLKASHYYVVYFKLGKTITKFKLENLNKFLTIAINDIA